jgi:glycosyltransferase involved in cell wall biosynthesis
VISVLSVAYPFAPVSRDAVGGAEQVLSMLDHALIEERHRSLVIAQAGSQIEGTLLSAPIKCDCIDETARSRAHHEWRRLIDYAVSHYAIDVIHFHGIDCAHYMPADASIPILVTLHLPLNWYEPELFKPARPVFFNLVSHSQTKRICSAWRAHAVIENGVRVDLLDAAVAKAGYALVMGRICAEKGFHHALEAAIRIDRELLIAGLVFPYEAHRRYFSEQIAPRLDHKRRLLGPLSWESKRLVLSAAQCLLVPSVAEETSSLVAMEAMACGTPVIAFRAGALVDIVEHGVTGFLVDSVEEMADAMLMAGSISPDVCRQRARARFCAQRMTAEYLRLYQRIAQSRQSRPIAAEGDS